MKKKFFYYLRKTEFVVINLQIEKLYKLILNNEEAN